MTTAYDGQSAGHADTLQQSDQRCQHETEKNRQRDRHEDVPAEIEHRDDDDSQNCRGYRAEQGQQLFCRACPKWLPRQLISSAFQD